MRHVTFVTTNDIKYKSAEHIVEKLNFSLDRASMEFEEIQSDGEGIARHKAEQAYHALQKPVIITDDTWSIPGLHGFPGAYMKEVNSWFSVEDWLRLTNSLADRRITFTQHAIYQDDRGQHYFAVETAATLLSEAYGESPVKIMSLITLDGQQSAAETLSQGKPLLHEGMPTVWHQLADWFATQEK